MNKEKSIKIMKNYIFPLILLLYPLIHYNIGVDITDTGYSFGSFLFSPQWGEEWVNFAFYLSNRIGMLLTNLPFGRTMMGINLYTGLFVSAAALCSYYYFAGRFPAWIAFAGEILAISLCWCPTVILYNYLTFLFFTGAVILLFKGAEQEKPLYLFLAGALLGMNVLVKFPNITETALILAFWYYCFLQKRKISRVLSETGICIAGFFAGAAIIFLKIIADGETAAYFNMIGSLFGLGSGATGGHALSDTLFAIADAYLVAVKWLMYWIVYAVAGMLAFFVMKGRFSRGLKILYTAGGLLVIRLLYGRGMFSLRYYAYDSMLQWACIFLVIAIAVCLAVMIGRNFTNQDKLLMSMVLVIILTTPLGSDNYLYLNINNLFIAAPAVFIWIWRLIRGGRTFFAWKLEIPLFPVKAVLSVILTVLMVQSIGFGFSFVFRDSSQGEPRDTRIEHNAVLKGMYTNRDNAEAIEDISLYCAENGLSSRKVVLYGNIPAMSGFLNMPSALSTSWPDLNSYTLESMQKEIGNIINAKDENDRPVILVSSEVGAWLSEDEEEMNYLGITQNKYDEDSKALLIRQLIQEKRYQEKFANHKFVIYE